MEIEGAVHALKPGSGIEIEPGLAHTATTKESDATFLVISQPPSHGDRIAAP
jgi:hypothetical protein